MRSGRAGQPVEIAAYYQLQDATPQAGGIPALTLARQYIARMHVNGFDDTEDIRPSLDVGAAGPRCCMSGPFIG